MNGIEMNEIERLLQVFSKYQLVQKSQKMRGLNDFNIFTILLDKADEVRLHSRFLHFLLNPLADHGQGTLFLDLFLIECGLQNYFSSAENCRVYKEYQNIDIYMTDGGRHIILENKIYAGDQNIQIQRYIEVINKENIDDSDFAENLVIIYLSLDRKKPSEQSIGKFELKNGFLIKDEEKYQFKVITYDVHILNWVEKSQVQISNITNLSVGIHQYKDVILKLYRRYEDKVMDLKKYIADSKEPKELYKTLKYISEEYQVLRKEMIVEFLKKSISALKDKVKDTEWEVVLSNKNGSFLSGKKHGFPLRIQQSANSKVIFGFEFKKNNYGEPFWGVVRRSADSVDFNKLKNEIKADLNNVHSSLDRSTAWWLKSGYYYDGDLYDKIIESEKTDTAVGCFVDNFFEVFNSCKDVIKKCNKILE